MSKIVEVPEDVEFSEWIEFSPRLGMSPDTVTVAFTKKEQGHTAIIRFGTKVLEKMRWKEKDRIGLFVSKGNKYKWMLCATSNGYRIGRDTNTSVHRRIQLAWPHEGVTFNKQKECRFEINKEKLILHIPM